MSSNSKPKKNIKHHSKSRDITVQLFNINILSNNRGPGFAALLKIISVTGFAYYIHKYYMNNCNSKKPCC